MAPPPRKVSNLVSFFETPSAPATSTTTDPTPLPSRVRTSRPLASSSTPSTDAPLPTRRPSLVTPASAAVVRSGTVKKHVRKFSIDSPVTVVVAPSPAPLASPATNAAATAASRTSPSEDRARRDGEHRERLSTMDWTPRVPKPSSPSPAPSPSTPSPPSVESLTNILAKHPPPTPISTSAQFRPHRVAPPPPPSTVSPAAGLAKTVVVPAHVTSLGEKTSLAMVVQKKKLEEKEKEKEKEDKTVVEVVAPKGVQPKKEETTATPPVVVEPARKEAPLSDKAEPIPKTSTPQVPAPAIRAIPSKVLSVEVAIARAPSPPPLSSSSQASTLLDSPLFSPPPFRKHISYTSYSSSSPSSSPSHPSRPHLPHSSTSITTTHNLPAALIFAHSSSPLILPALDSHLRSLPLVSFSKPSGVLSPSELPAWNAYLAGPRPSFLSRIYREVFPKKRGSGKYVDVEKQRHRGEGGEGREGIFPPLHLLPEGITVMDLKLNRTKARPVATLSALMSTLTDSIIAGEGSATGISLQTVESFRDIMQMVTLIVSGSASSLLKTGWAKSIFVTLPAVVSLDFVSAFGLALVWLWVFTLIALFAVYELWRFTGRCSSPLPSSSSSSFHPDLSPTSSRPSLRNSRGYKIFITFLATSLYLPLSKLAIGALAWTSDFWPIPNPYLVQGVDDPIFASLGDSKEFYGGEEFCWRTTMRKREGLEHFNWAWVVVPVAAATVVWLTLFLPWRLYRVVREEAPKVDKYTELGELRMDQAGEYMRLLDEDKSPFSFMYRDYRRPWAHFKAIYMLVKLVNILLICLLTKNNCVFRAHTTSSLGIIREASLVGFMTLFLLADTISKPFLGYLANNSDRVSRISFVCISFIGLMVALGVHGEAALGGGVLILVEVVTYSFNVFFAVIGLDFVQREVHRAQRRLDFSIDLFSPRLDLAKHVSRRVWQDTLSAILLASPEFKMLKDARISFTDVPGLAPQLISFTGSQAERHIENLKILRTIGLVEYHKAMLPHNAPPSDPLLVLRRTIQRHITGPDIIFSPPSSSPSISSSNFGRLDVQPFPFVCIFHPDNSPSPPILLSSTSDLESLVDQNSTPEALGRKRVRLALRALEGQLIDAPHSATHRVSSKDGIEVESRVQYKRGVLRLARNSDVEWRGYGFSCGFRVEVDYNDGVGQDSTGELRYDERTTVSAEDLGIPLDFSLTPAVAKLLRRNRSAIEQRLPHIEQLLRAHRDYFHALADFKDRTLSHAFLFSVATDDALDLPSLDALVRTTERDPKVQTIAETHRGALEYLMERTAAIGRSRIHQWWFILWDDLWRRNCSSIPSLARQPESFSPFWRGSIAYVPMARADLEVWLTERGMGVKEGQQGFFNSGFLNRVYFYLDEITFAGTANAIPIHLGPSSSPVKFTSLDHAGPTRKRPQGYERVSPTEPGSWLSTGTRRTGDGEAYDDWSERDRLAFPFEEVYDQPGPLFVEGHRWDWVKDFVVHRLAGSAKTWLGLRPFHHDHRPQAGQGVTLDLRGGKEGWELPRRRIRLDEST